MPAALITCENLVKIYKVPAAEVEVVALQGLELEVAAGEFVAIVGRSGSGKTTLMNILGALDQPSAGTCVVAGHHLTRLGEREQDTYRRRVVGHVWQNAGSNLAPDLTAQQNVELPLLLAGVSGRRRATHSQRLLELVGLKEYASRLPWQLSGGERQRLAIAVALANGPQVLLADEPTGELDSHSAQEVLTTLQTLTRDHGVTLLLVTHDPAIAGQADRTLAIRDGRTSTETIRRAQPLASDEAPGEATANPVSPTAGLSPTTHQEAAVLDSSGILQLPEAAVAAVAFDGRAELVIHADHVALWPRALAPEGNGNDASAAGTTLSGLPTSDYREAVIIDRAGRLQLSEEALDRVPFGRRALVRVRDDHVELWPLGAVHTSSALTAEHTEDQA